MATVSTATYIQRGEALDYVNAGDAIIPANTVVSLGTRIGVAGTDIAPGQIGSVHVIGVFEIKKAASQDIKMGDALYFDADAGEITNEGEGKVPAGYAAAASKSDATTVAVNISFPPAAASGSAPAPATTKLADLTDVEVGSAKEGDILKYTSEKWTATTPET